jgi:hypothetical protein
MKIMAMVMMIKRRDYNLRGHLKINLAPQRLLVRNFNNQFCQNLSSSICDDKEIETLGLPFRVHFIHFIKVLLWKDLQMQRWR